MPEHTTDRVQQILSWYPSDNPGKLAGTGKLVILPVDQGFEHGPARSFAKNPAGYDPEYHVQLAIESGCNAYAAPLGFIEAIAGKYAGQIPLILKLNNSDSLSKLGGAPISAVTGSVREAVRLGRPQRAAREPARAHRGGQGERAGGGGLELPPRLRHLQGGRDRRRHLR